MRAWLGILLLLLPLSVAAAIDTYEFRDEATRERFQQLTAELRCPKCQNQNLADSNSPIAQDLRGEVYRMLEAGEADAAIIDFMVVRYGDFVRYRPKMSGATWLLWFGPALLLLIGAVVVLLLTRRRKGAATASGGGEQSALSAAEQQRLQRLLDQDTDK